MSHLYFPNFSLALPTQIYCSQPSKGKYQSPSDSN